MAINQQELDLSPLIIIPFEDVDMEGYLLRRIAEEQMNEFLPKIDQKDGISMEYFISTLKKSLKYGRVRGLVGGYDDIFSSFEDFLRRLSEQNLISESSIYLALDYVVKLHGDDIRYLYQVFSAYCFEGKEDRISKLPEIILVLITEHHIISVAGELENKEALLSVVRLSHVCRSFRQAVLENARLWAFVSNDFWSSSLIQCCLKRSRNCELTVVVRCRPPKTKKSTRTMSCKKFLDIVLPHAYRWRFLSIVVPEHPNYRVEDLAAIKQLPQNLDLPDLKSLRIVCGDDIDPNLVDDGDESRGMIRLSSSWNVPLLEKFHVENILVHQLPSAKHLTSAAFTFGLVRERDTHWNLQPFQEFLVTASSLKSLSVTTSYTSDFDVSSDDEDFTQLTITAMESMTEIPNITSLEFRFTDDQLRHLQLLLLALRFPNVSTLTLDFPESPNYPPCADELFDTLNNLMRMCFANGVNTFSNVTHLTISAFLELRDILELPADWDRTFTLPVAHLPPRLEHLILQIPIPLSYFAEDTVTDVHASISLVSLRDLTLRKCHHTSIEWVERFLAWSTTQRSFEQVTIERCRLMDDKDALLEFIPAEKLSWIACDPKRDLDPDYYSELDSESESDNSSA